MSNEQLLEKAPETKSENESKPQVNSFFEEDLGLGGLVIEDLENQKKEEPNKTQEQSQQQQNVNNEQKTSEEEQLFEKRFQKDVKKAMKSYREVEVKMNEVARENARMRKLLEEKKTEPVKESQNTEEFYARFIENPKETLNDLVRSAVDERVNPVIEPLRAREVTNNIRQTINDFKKSRPDFDEYNDDILEIVRNEIPENSNLPTDKIIQIAYAMAKEKNLSKATEKAKENVRNEEQMKKSAFVEGGNGANNNRLDTNSKKTPEDSIKESIVNAKNEHVLFT